MDVAHLLSLSFVKLSNGQTRRARIARALLRHPSMLILDEPLSKSFLIWIKKELCEGIHASMYIVGLDVQHRQKMLKILGDLAESGMPVVLVLRPQDEFPSWATDVVALKDLKIDWRGDPAEYIKKRDAIMAKEKADKEAYLKKQEALEQQQHVMRDPVVELKKVNVIYSGNKILDNITWTVRKGERWALLGPNGR